MGQSFLNRSGGMAGIKVKCSPEKPRQRAKNTVWVGTDISKGKVIVSDIMPSTRPNGTDLKEGDIWLATTSLDYDIFPSINGVKLGSAFQWADGFWNPKKAEAFDGDKWTAFCTAFGGSRLIVPELADPENPLNMVCADREIGTPSFSRKLWFEKKLFEVYQKSSAALSTDAVMQTSTANMLSVDANTGLANLFFTYCYLWSDVNRVEFSLIYFATSDLSKFSIKKTRNGNAPNNNGGLNFVFVDFEREGVPLGTPITYYTQTASVGTSPQPGLSFPSLNRRIKTENIHYIRSNFSSVTTEIPLTDERLKKMHYGALFIFSDAHGGNANLSELSFVKS